MGSLPCRSIHMPFQADAVDLALPVHQRRPRQGVGEATRSARSLGVNQVSSEVPHDEVAKTTKGCFDRTTLLRDAEAPQTRQTGFF